MPAANKFALSKEILLIAVVVIAALVVLALFYPSFTIVEEKQNKPKLTCSAEGEDAIKCSWEDCELMLPPEKSELVIGREPNYVEAIEITSVKGSTVLYPPSPVGGEYTLFVTCQNGMKGEKVLI